MRKPDYVLTIDNANPPSIAIPPSLNKYLRMHWAKRREVKELWYWLVKNEAAWVPGLKGKRRVRITITFPVQRRRDRDNWSPKVILDALVNNAILWDDSPEWCDIELPVLRVEKGVSRTVIEIWEVDNESD